MKTCDCCLAELDQPYRHALCPSCRREDDALCCYCQKPITGLDLEEGRTIHGRCWATSLREIAYLCADRASTEAYAAWLEARYEDAPQLKPSGRRKPFDRPARRSSPAKKVNASFVDPRPPNHPTT